MLKFHDIQIRDPFIRPATREGQHYLFGTADKNCWELPATGFDCYDSAHLQHSGGRCASRKEDRPS